MASRLFVKSTSLLRNRARTAGTFPLKYRSVPSRLRFASNGVAGQGNPSIVDSLPDPANEIDANEELAATGIPSEIVPPSSFLTNGAEVNESDATRDWSRSYYGLSAQPFSKEAAEVLQAPLDPRDIEIKPGELYVMTFAQNTNHSLDGLIYLPEIKYRRILNKAFGPGGWGLAPRSETNVGPKVVSREYALVCLGRYVDRLWRRQWVQTCWIGL